MTYSYLPEKYVNIDDLHGSRPLRPRSLPVYNIHKYLYLARPDYLSESETYESPDFDSLFFRAATGIHKTYGHDAAPEFSHYNPEVGNIYRGHRPNYESHVSQPYAQDDPPVIVKHLDDVFCHAGQDITLRAEVHTSLKPKVEWIKDGKTLHSNMKRWMRYDGYVAELIIAAANEQDKGWYSLRVANEHGQRETACMVKVSNVLSSTQPKANPISSSLLLSSPHPERSIIDNHAAHEKSRKVQERVKRGMRRIAKHFG